MIIIYYLGSRGSLFSMCIFFRFLLSFLPMGLCGMDSMITTSPVMCMCSGRLLCTHSVTMARVTV